MMIIFENSQQNLKVSYVKVGNTGNHFSICRTNFRLIWKYRRTSCHFDLLTKSQGSFSHQLHTYFFLKKKCEHDFFQFVQKCDNFCSRFLLTIGCPMAFHNYPMDLQECNLKLQSCKYMYVLVTICNLSKNAIKLQSPPPSHHRILCQNLSK